MVVTSMKKLDAEAFDINSIFLPDRPTAFHLPPFGQILHGYYHRIIFVGGRFENRFRFFGIGADPLKAS